MPSRERPGLVLTAACLAQFMVVLDVSIVNVALPSVRDALDLGADELPWVVNAYTLAFAGFLLLGGRAADLYGRRRMFLVGLVLFGVASLAGGLADDPALLLAARAAQGLGGAVLSPASLTILTTSFVEGPARSRALGAWAAVGGLGGAVGGLAGGVLVHLLSWRWIFLVNVPVVVLTALVALTAVRESRDLGPRRLDVPGALLVTAGLVAFVFAVVRTETAGWSSPTVWGGFVVAVVLLGAFGLVQRSATAPLVPLDVFASRWVSAANASMLLIASAMFSMWFLVSLHLQGVLGFDALAAGLAFLPQSASIVIGSQLSSRLLPRFGVRAVLVGGAVLTALGFVWFSALDADASWVAGVLGPGVAVALGMGTAFPALATAATNGVVDARAGLASGLLNTARQVGGSIGLAVLATVASARTAALVAQGVPTPVALTAGTTRAFAVAAGGAVLAALVALLLPRGRWTRTAPAGTGAVAPARVRWCSGRSGARARRAR